jgi:hypothetical protein
LSSEQKYPVFPGVDAYYAMLDGEHKGPFTIEELEELSQAGFLCIYTPVKCTDSQLNYWLTWADIRPWLMPLPPPNVARPFSEYKVGR